MQKKQEIENSIYTSKEFGLRLAMLRERRKISARHMSLELGQNKNYISSIESGNNFPTMKNFFDICIYLQVSPEHFFHTQEAPVHIPQDDFIDLIVQLPQRTREHLYLFLVDLLEMGQFP